jgi:hypothetical protein
MMQKKKDWDDMQHIATKKQLIVKRANLIEKKKCSKVNPRQLLCSQNDDRQKCQFPVLAAERENGKAGRERTGRVPDHQGRAVAEDAEVGLQEARPVVGVKVRGCFVGQQT